MLSWLLERAGEEADAFVRQDGEVMTYAGLATAARSVADLLMQAVGDVERRAVGIAVADEAGFLVSALAAMASGAVVVPLDARSSDAELEEAAGRARVVATVLGRDDTLVVAPGDAARHTYDSAAGMLLCAFGSLGAPRGAVLSTAGLKTHIDAIALALSLDRTSRTPLTLPLFYGYSLIGQALATLRAGGTLLDFGPGPGEIAPADDPALRIAQMRRLGADSLQSVPAALHRYAHAALALPESERPRLRQVVSACARFTPQLHAELRQAFPRARLWNHYGLTEAPHITAISDAEPPFAEGSVGRPIAGVRVIADPETGELCVTGPSVMMGYLDDPEATGRALRGGVLHTGDLGRVDAAGYVWVTGRVDAP